MKPVMVEIITYAPTQYFHCQHCEVVWNQADVESIKKFHADALQSSIPPEMMREYQTLSDWVLDAAERYGGRVVFKVIDAASIEGLLKSARYGVRKYPAIVLDSKETLRGVGADFRKVETLISQHLALQSA